MNVDIFCEILPLIMKDVYINSFRHILITSTQKNFVDLRKIIPLNIACLRYWKNWRVMLNRERFLGHFWLIPYGQDASLWDGYKNIKINKRLSFKRCAKNQGLTEIQFLDKINSGIPQASKLGAIYFKINLYDLFFIINDVDAEKVWRW